LPGILGRHNQLDNQLFSSLGFGLTAQCTGSSAIYYLTHECLLMPALSGLPSPPVL